MDRSSFYYLALRELPGVGEHTLTRLLDLAASRSEDVRAIVDASAAHLTSAYCLPDKAAARLLEQRDRHFQRCEWLRAELRRAGGELLTQEHPLFPMRLLHNLRKAPPMLFSFGNLEIFESPCIAILSSREITDQTVPATVALLRAARRESLSVAVGGMKTTHRLAGITARAIGVRRVVVLDRGLFAAFASDFATDPFGSGKKRARFDPNSALVVSPFRLEDHASPNGGRRRDEIIAALGHLVFASSARPGGEVERICLAAIAQGRRVLTWPNTSRRLLMAGATCVTPHLLKRGLRPLLEIEAASAHRDNPRPPNQKPAQRSRSRGA